MHCDVKASVAASSHTACAVAPVAIFVFLSLRRSPYPFFPLSSRLPFSLFGSVWENAMTLFSCLQRRWRHSFLLSLPSTRIRRFVASFPPSRSRAATAGIITCNGKIAKPLLSPADSQSRKSSLVNLGLLLRAFNVELQFRGSIGLAQRSSLPLFCQLERTL